MSALVARGLPMTITLNHTIVPARDKHPRWSVSSRHFWRVEFADRRSKDWQKRPA